MSVSLAEIPTEFDLPLTRGFSMKGWDFSSVEIGEAIKSRRLLNPAIELGTNACPWNCDFCFTENPTNLAGRKHRLANELSITRRLELIDEVHALGGKSINFVGAGEPTLDPHFWEILERIHHWNMVPIVYSEGSLRLNSPGFAQRLFDLGATIVLKVNSLTNADYQNRVLQGIRPKPGIPQIDYTQERNKALETLIRIGFNRTVPTRLAFDTIICQENLNEIEDIHKFARINNIFVLFVGYLPSGRTTNGHTSAISWPEQLAIFRRLAEIDRTLFGLEHAAHFPYAGGVPCTIRGLGLFIKIQGQVFDCPGQTVPLGNLNNESLNSIWEKARDITSAFTGECFPRQQFWARLAAGQRQLPTLP